MNNLRSFQLNVADKATYEMPLNNYQLLSSTRFDPFLTTLGWNDDRHGPCAFFLLSYHFDRLASAAKIHKWDHVSSLLTYDYLKSACLDVISEQQQRLQTGSSRPFRVNPLQPLFLQVQLRVIGSNYTFTRRSYRRGRNPFNDDFHHRSDFTSIVQQP